jgi:signal transduction histidine kinase
MIENPVESPESRRRTESLEGTMLALRDAREVHDVLSIVARRLARDFRRSCVAYEFRDGTFLPVVPSTSAVDHLPLPAYELDLDALRTRTVVRRGSEELLGITSDGQLRALFVLESGAASLVQEDMKFLRALAAHVSLALSNALAFDQLRRYAAEGAALTEAARTILGFTDLESLAASLCRLAIRLVLAERACLYDNLGDELVRVAYATVRPGLEPPVRIPLNGATVAASVAAAFGSAPSIVSRLRLPGSSFSSEHNGSLVLSRSTSFERAELRVIETLISLAALAIRNVDLYEQSTRANQALAESNAFKDDLMAMFAHDFKGPLTVISGYSELLLDIDDPTVTRSAETIVEQTRRLAKLSEDALALAATQSAGFSLSRAPEDVAGFLRATVLPLDPHGDRIVVEDPPEPVTASFDRSRMRHVVDNVVGNALKYSKGRVAVRVVPRAREVCIEVADSGIGIPQSEREKIFSRFGRGSNARSLSIAGSGVGLYIAKKIIDIHHGRLEVESQENEGSTFRIVLPL